MNAITNLNDSSYFFSNQPTLLENLLSLGLKRIESATNNVSIDVCFKFKPTKLIEQ